MSAEFEIKVTPKNGVSIKQLEGVAVYDPMYGFAGGVAPVELTPYEAEKLIEELRKATTAARSNQTKSKFNIP